MAVGKQAKPNLPCSHLDVSSIPKMASVVPAQRRHTSAQRGVDHFPSHAQGTPHRQAVGCHQFPTESFSAQPTGATPDFRGLQSSQLFPTSRNGGQLGRHEQGTRIITLGKPCAKCPDRSIAWRQTVTLPAPRIYPPLGDRSPSIVRGRRTPHPTPFSPAPATRRTTTRLRLARRSPSAGGSVPRLAESKPPATKSRLPPASTCKCCTTSAWPSRMAWTRFALGAVNSSRAPRSTRTSIRSRSPFQ